MEFCRGDLTRPYKHTMQYIVDSYGFLSVALDNNSCVVVLDKRSKISCFNSNDIKHSQQISSLHAIALSMYSNAVYVTDHSS